MIDYNETLFTRQLWRALQHLVFILTTYRSLNNMTI